MGKSVRIDWNLKAVLDRDISIKTFGLLGRWSVTIMDRDNVEVPNGNLQAGRDQCIAYALAQRVSPLRIRYTDRARPYRKPPTRSR